MEANRQIHIYSLLSRELINQVVDNAVRGIYAVRITAKIPDSLYDELANQGIVVCKLAAVRSPLMLLFDVHFSSHAPNWSRKIRRAPSSYCISTKPSIKHTVKFTLLLFQCIWDPGVCNRSSTRRTGD